MSSPIGLQPELEQTLDVQVHRLAANLIFDQHELSPYHGLVRVFEPDHDERLSAIDAFDDRFVIDTSNVWKGQLADPQGDIDDGLYEYSYSLWTDDEAGDRGANFKFRPGYPNAVNVDTGELIGGMPTDCPESIRVQVEATNLSKSEVLRLLQALADHIGLNPDYFTDPHDWSRIYGLETYARVDREYAIDDLVGKDGVLEHIAQFSNGRGKGEYHWDHEQITGKYEAVALSPDNWKRLIPDQTLAKRLKCYQPDNVRTDGSEDDPLYHHKLEAQYWSGYYPSGDDSLRWDGYDAAVSELKQTTINALNWAGLPVSPDQDVYVEDAYFDVQESDDPVKVVSNPMPDLKAHEEATARDELANPESTPAEWDVVKALVEDGEQHHETLADGAGRSTRSVYRAIERFEFIESDGGEVQFKDDVVRDEVSEIVGRLRDYAENAVDAIRRTADKANPLSPEDGDPSPLERWCNRHGIVPKSSYDGLEFELDRPVSKSKLREILRAGYQAAEGSSLLTSEFEDAVIHWRDHDGDQHRNWQVATQHGHETRLLGIEPLW